MGGKRKYKNLFIEQLFHKVENPLDGVPKEQIEELYRTHTFEQIMQLTGCTYTQIIACLKKYGIKNQKKRGRRGPNKEDNGKV